MAPCLAALRGVEARHAPTTRRWGRARRTGTVSAQGAASSPLCGGKQSPWSRTSSRGAPGQAGVGRGVMDQRQTVATRLHEPVLGCLGIVLAQRQLQSGGGVQGAWVRVARWRHGE